MVFTHDTETFITHETEHSCAHDYNCPLAPLMRYFKSVSSDRDMREVDIFGFAKVPGPILVILVLVLP